MTIKTHENIKAEIAKLRQTEEDNKKEKERQELNESRAMAKAEAYDEVRKGRKEHTDPKTGEKSDLWDHAMKHADNTLAEGARGYDSWTAVMSALVVMYGDLVAAVAQSGSEIRSDVLNASLAGTELGNVPVIGGIADEIIPGVGGLKIPGLLNAKDKIGDGLSSLSKKITGSPEIGIPILEHKIHFSNDDELVIDPLQRSDKVSHTGQLDTFFKEGVHEWLEEQGYKPVKSGSNKFVDSHGAALTKDKFDALRDDKTNGFGQFLKDNFHDLEFAPSSNRP